MAAMMRRQDTIQSVDSFASHDDDFAEYGDESMGELTAWQSCSDRRDEIDRSNLFFAGISGRFPATI